MSYDSNIQWKTHAKRFARGFPYETFELYIGLAVLTGLVGVIALEAYGWQLTDAEVQEMMLAFKLLMYTFLLVPFLRGFGFVVGVPLRKRLGFKGDEL